MVFMQKTYQQIIPTHEEYLIAQKRWASNESATPKFAAGQLRYLHFMLRDFPCNLKVLDLGCGDGTGLKVLKNMAFKEVVGVDLCETKLALAKEVGFPVVTCDFHALPFPDRSFDVVYSSHSLEHAYRPAQVVSEIVRVLRSPGILLCVLPYPDTGDWNDEAHGAKYELGTNVIDEGQSVVQFFKNCGFGTVETSFDNFREPEVWVTAYLSG
jgi:ubiquinone/menaquinone biosynthesis C-methylase UbiE